ncbi:ATP-grasp domain-containing protein [Patescibacteria group bacterium]
MILYEFEGKKILSEGGIDIPKSQLISSPKQNINLKLPFILKAQVLTGKRKKAGGIIQINSNKDLKKKLSNIFALTIHGEKVSKVLVEEKIDIKQEYYISISYDTDYRSPVIVFSTNGGEGIEKRISKSIPFNTLSLKVPQKYVPEKIYKLLPKLIKIFIDNDLLLLEINPFVETKEGELVAVDAKLKIDDTAIARHKNWNYKLRSTPGYTPTIREKRAKNIDQNDYRGSAGSTFFDLPGNIAVLASGGGASLTAMDAIIASGGKPANYTEYSGNPPREKVEKLTEIVLSKKYLKGLWVVGAVANFTDIYETLSGFLQALRKVKPKPKYPILIRRGGPRDKEAFEMLKKVKDFNLHLYGQEISITESAKIMAKLAKKYETSK